MRSHKDIGSIMERREVVDPGCDQSVVAFEFVLVRLDEELIGRKRTEDQWTARLKTVSGNQIRRQLRSVDQTLVQSFAVHIADHAELFWRKTELEVMIPHRLD